MSDHDDDDENKPFFPATEPGTLQQQLDRYIDCGTTLAAGMAANLPPGPRAELAHLRATGWHVVSEVAVDEHGAAGVYLSATSPDGFDRRFFSQLKSDGVHLS